MVEATLEELNQENLRKLRYRKGIKARVIADALGVPLGYVGRIERMLAQPPFGEQLRIWGELLGLNTVRIRRLMEACNRFDHVYVKGVVSRYEGIIAKLTEERNAYREKCEWLQGELDDAEE